MEFGVSAKIAAILGIYALACVGAFVFATWRPQPGWAVFALLLVGGVHAAGRWADRWRRRAFDPQTPEDKARALDRQILQSKIAVGIFVGLGLLIALMALLERRGSAGGGGG